jgi:hypothetical protein
MLFRLCFFALCLVIAPASARALDNIVAAENLTAQAGGTTIRVPRVIVEGTPLPRPELARLLDPKDPAPFTERLARFAADRVRIPELRGEAKAGEEERRFAYKNVVLEEVSGGRVGAARAAFLEETLQKKDNALTARYENLWADGVDLAHLAHALAEPRPDEKEAAKPLADKAGIESLAIGSQEGAFSARAAHIGLSSLRLRAFSSEAQRAISQVDATPAKEADQATLALALMDAFVLGSFEAHDLAISGRDAASAGQYAIAARGLAVKGFADRVAQQASIEGFSLQSADGGRLSFERLDFGLLDFAGALRAGPRAPFFSSADFSDLEGDAPDPGAGRLKFALKKGGAKFAGFREGVPTKAALNFDGFAIDLTGRDESNAKFLRALGYSSLELSGGVDAEWRAATRDLQVERLRIDARDMGAVTLAANFSGVDGAVLSFNPIIASVALLPARLTRFEATLEGGALIDRLIAQEARSSGADSLKLRADYARDLKNAVLAELGESEKSRRLAAAIEKFVASPRRLHVKLTAQKGLGVLDLMKSLPDILADLDVEATAD